MGKKKKKTLAQEKKESTYYAIKRRKAERLAAQGRSDEYSMKDVNREFRQYAKVKRSALPDCSLTNDCPRATSSLKIDQDM